jgi:hypothetical protein
MQADSRSFWRYLHQSGRFRSRARLITAPMILAIGAISEHSVGYAIWGLVTAVPPAYFYLRWRKRDSVADDDGRPQLW